MPRLLESYLDRNFPFCALFVRTCQEELPEVLLSQMCCHGKPDDNSSLFNNALNIGDGDSASATFAYMAMGRYGAHQIESLKKDLLAYCGQDTLAMVKLHERLYDEVNKGEYVSI